MSASAPLLSASPVGDAAGEAPVRIVFIGAGPAAAMLLERLLASHRRDHPGLRLQIRLVDPHEPGGGRIWRRAQSPLLKLNSMLEDVAFFTDASCSVEGPVEPGPSLAEWVRRVRAGEIPFPEWCDEALEAEIADIRDRDFPTRRLNNAYLGWAFREVLRRSAPNADVAWHRGVAVAVRPAEAAATGTAGTAGRLEPHTVLLESGEALPADIVVHAVGHNGSLPSDDSIRLGAFADRHGLRYVAPAFTADLDLDWIPAGRDVIVRGMGLAAVDLTVLLAEGRGGRFSRDAAGTLTYLPSGREPRLWLGSRRGVPYRSKATSVPVGAPVELEYLGKPFHERLSGRSEPLDFERDVWPLVCAEMVTGYYRELFTGHPGRVIGTWEDFSASLREILAAPRGHESAELGRLVRAHVPDPDDRFELAAFDRPLAFADGAEDADATDEAVGGDDGAGGGGTGTPGSAEEEEAVQRRVTAHIAQDLRQRTRQEHSATQALFLTLLFAYMSVAEIPAERWNAVSRARSLPKRWHSFFSYLASGPPGHRLEELLALAEAGTVRFLGADVELLLDEREGRFTASGRVRTSRGSARASISAEILIDAWLPDAQAARSDNPLLRHLVASGQAEELRVADADYAGSTGQIVVGAGGALPGAPRQFALGPFTSTPGAGAFTRPGIDSLPFRLHDRSARAILDAATAVAESVRAASRSSFVRVRS